jgi:acetyl esterase/lipase
MPSDRHTTTPDDHGVTWHDVVWRDDLLARVYVPPELARTGAAVVDVHGGAWNSQDRTLGAAYGAALAATGCCVVAIDFRDGRVAQHPAGSDDVAAAVGWVRDHGIRLGIDPARVGLIGSSSGGHLALYAALTAVAVPFVAAFWPPVDPLARARYAASLVGRPVPDGQRFDAANLVRSSNAYFGSDDAMAEASIAAVVRSGRAAQLPPVWLVRAGADLNVPASLLDELVVTYRDAGGDIELTDYPGEVHGFGHGRSSEGARRFQSDLIERVNAALGGQPAGAGVRPEP